MDLIKAGKVTGVVFSDVELEIALSAIYRPLTQSHAYVQ